MGLETGLTRLGRGRDWVLRLPPQARWAVGAAVAVAVTVLILTDTWPLLLIGAALLFGRFGSSGRAEVPAPMVERARRKALRAAHGGVLPISELAAAPEPEPQPREPTDEELLERETRARLAAARALFRPGEQREPSPPPVLRTQPLPAPPRTKARSAARASSSAPQSVEHGDAFWRRKPSAPGPLVE